MDRGAPAARAGDLLEAGLSRDRALLGALRRCVPDFADWCVVDYHAADGELTAVHSGYPDPAKEALILEIRRRYRAERGENGDVLAALESGVPFSTPRSSTGRRCGASRVARRASGRPRRRGRCSISMRGERGQMYRLAVAHFDPVRDRLAQALIEREALPSDAPAGAAAVMQTGRTQVVEAFGDDLLVQSLKDQRSHEIVRTLGLGSSVSVPLVARGRMLGAISLIREAPPAPVHRRPGRSRAPRMDRRGAARPAACRHGGRPRALLAQLEAAAIAAAAGNPRDDIALLALRAAP